MTDSQSCPISVKVFPDNISDTATLSKQIKRCCPSDGITGMNKKDIERVLLTQDHPHRWFDETNVMEVKHRDFPHDRLILCRNP
ncbi:MAG: hypothetical protein OXE77_02900 [Flavobacteriaceae bacterium]|nr:hypothetical protein [Flavobacteriaceae bacterium]MCY4266701.1 hypothetical protein [Flavobacteriaceae bacterium]MCY4298952.1 hypothetical protein [Flavobacteriaceae bacterium]